MVFLKKKKKLVYWISISGCDDEVVHPDDDNDGVIFSTHTDLKVILLNVIILTMHQSLPWLSD